MATVTIKRLWDCIGLLAAQIHYGHCGKVDYYRLHLFSLPLRANRSSKSVPRFPIGPVLVRKHAMMSTDSPPQNLRHQTQNGSHIKFCTFMAFISSKRGFKYQLHYCILHQVAPKISRRDDSRAVLCLLLGGRAAVQSRFLKSNSCSKLRGVIFETAVPAILICMDR